MQTKPSIQKSVCVIDLIFRAGMTALILGALMTSTLMKAHADTTADCGRFFLKYNPDTKKTECVGGSRRNLNPEQQIQQLSRQLSQTVRLLQRALDGAEAILRSRQLNQETERRVRDLLTEAQQRTREAQRHGRALVQAQRSRRQELQSQQRQLTQSQIQLAQQLEQRQRSLTQQLLAEQRSRSQDIRARRLN